MGLDITAYSGLKRIGDVNPEADFNEGILDVSEAILEFTEQHWPGRSAPLVAGTYEAAEHFGFRAGSYSGYNAWRDWLAKLVGWKNAEDCWSHYDSAKFDQGPFYELIDFADNEGVIGSHVATKLANDFHHWLAKAEASTDGPHEHWDGYDLGKYKEWMKACQMAADNGAIDFH